MVVNVTALGCACALLAVCAGVPSGGADGKKQLRNVIITSFGELPYEPMEQSGFFQADVFPVSLDDDVRQQTMDVALRTGILVEDPNEKKTPDVEEDATDDGGGATSTNTKRQVSNEYTSREENVKETRDEFLSPRVKGEYRKPKGRKVLEENSNGYRSAPRNFGYEFRQSRKQIPYHSTTDPNGFNINREYYGDLGEGWNLQDAEEILQGRNYNVLIQIPNGFHDGYPEPPAREMPPPMFVPEARHPMYYPFPNFGYMPLPQPAFGPPIRRPANVEGYDEVDRHTDLRTQTVRGKSRNLRQVVPYRHDVGNSGFQSRGGQVPYTEEVYFDRDYLSGI